MRHRLGVGLVIAVVVLAVIATASAVAALAADHQTTTIDRRVSCATELGALQLIAFARNPVAGAAAATVSTGDPNKSTLLVGVDTRYKHFVLSKSCRRVSKRIALTHRGLTSAGVVHGGDSQSPSIYCGATRHVLVRFRLGFDAAGKPVSATIAVRTQPKARNGKRRRSKPIGYVQWSPQRSVTYYSRACTVQS